MAAPAVTTLRDALTAARSRIEALGSDEAALEAELLMMHALGVDRARLYQRLSEPLEERVEAAFSALLMRRLAREPVAYITGHREFFGLELEVSPVVLIPRPETETLVQAVLDFSRRRAGGLTIADIGTGSGAIAVALAHELPEARIVATDTSREALEVCGRNAGRHGVAGQIDFRLGDLLEPVEVVDVVAANLPYVTTAQWQELPPEIRDYEPHSALDGGEDGLDLLRRLITSAPKHLSDGGALFCEIGDWQGDAVHRIAGASFRNARIEVLPDLAARDRVLAVYR